MQWIFQNINQPGYCTCFYMDNTWRFKTMKFRRSASLLEIFGNSMSSSSIQKPIEVQKAKKPIEFKNSKIEKSKQKS